jgi:molecular chaperone Hsp33
VLIERDRSVAAAGGFILSLMPGAGEDVIARVEADISGIRPMTSMLSEGMTLSDIAAVVLKTGGYRITRTIDIGYRCRCSKEKVERMLLSLGKAELEKLAKESASVEVTCQFCDKKYNIPVEDVLKKAK